ncbi:hypothetical protein MRB53_041980 [Persea americana]|nr:hypothetical protein MRB53_041980 [Persea americana]
MSEEVIGRTIQKYRIPRRKLILMSKVGRIVADPETRGAGELVAFCDDAASRSKDYTNQFGLSRAAIFNAVADSLERLRTPYIDVLHVHRFDDSVEPEETMRALHDLVCSGKVRYLAASSMWAFELATLQATAERHGWTRFIAVQNHYSLLYREEEREMLKFARRTGLGIMPWSPLAEGYLARPRTRATASLRSATWGNRYGFGESLADQAIIDRVEEVAEREGRSMSQVALAWLNERVTAPVVGMNSIKRLDEACLGGYKLSGETVRYLEAPYVPKVVLGHA